jgi:hypothetical protein
MSNFLSQHQQLQLPTRHAQTAYQQKAVQACNMHKRLQRLHVIVPSANWHVERRAEDVF